MMNGDKNRDENRNRGEIIEGHVEEGRAASIFPFIRRRFHGDSIRRRGGGGSSNGREISHKGIPPAGS